MPHGIDPEAPALATGLLGPVEVRRQAVHVTADGRRLLVLHGDEFDSALRCACLADRLRRLSLVHSGQAAADAAVAAPAPLRDAA